MVEYSKFFSELTRRFRASDVRELLKMTEGRRIISFAGGLPDPRVFPKTEIGEIANMVARELGEKALQYSPTPGVGEFRGVLKGFLERSRVRIGEGDEIVVTSGSQEALFLASMALVSPGDVVLIEEPGYLAAINVFKALGARLVPVRVDDEGLDPEHLAEVLRMLDGEGVRPKLVYTNPTSNNPSGTTMPIDRRREVLELASRYDLLVFEDDPYSFFTFDDSVRFEHLKTMDKEGRVVYFGTFSKILTPGLRLGWVAGPSEIVSRVELVKQIVDLHTSTLDQYIAMEAIRRGVVERVIEKAKILYRKKRDLMLSALDETMSDFASWTRPIGGFFIFLRISGGIDMRSLFPKAVERGVAYVPGDAFYVTPGAGRNTARLSYSFNREEEIFEGVRLLSEVIKEGLASSGKA